MKIDVNTLYKFIKKASLSGNIPTMYVDISSEGLHCRIKNINNVCMTDTKLSIDTGNTETERLYIKNSDMFLKVLKTFSGDVTLEKVGDYLLKITDSDNKRTAHLVLGSQTIIDNIVDRELPKIDTVRNIVVDKKFFNNALSDIRLTNINVLNIKTENDTLLFTVGSENESDVLINKKHVGEGDDVEVEIGGYLKEITDSLEGNSEIELRIGSNMPVIFKENIDDIEFTCLVAPIINN